MKKIFWALVLGAAVAIPAFAGGHDGGHGGGRGCGGGRVEHCGGWNRPCDRGGRGCGGWGRPHDWHDRGCHGCHGGPDRGLANAAAIVDIVANGIGILNTIATPQPVYTVPAYTTTAAQPVYTTTVQQPVYTTTAPAAAPAYTTGVR